MKKIANLAKNNGYKTEVYHCSFDPDSLDMVIIRDLDVRIFRFDFTARTVPVTHKRRNS